MALRAAAMSVGSALRSGFQPPRFISCLLPSTRLIQLSLFPRTRALHATSAFGHWNNHHTTRLRTEAIAKKEPIPAAADPKQTVYYSRRNIQGSPWKVNLVARQIRGLTIDDAITQTQFSHKLAAEQINQVLRIAKQNAKVNNGITDNSNLYVLESFVGKGLYGKTVRKANKGRGYNAKRRKAHYFLKLRHGPPPKPEPRRNNYILQTQRVLKELHQYPPKIRASLDSAADVRL